MISLAAEWTIRTRRCAEAKRSFEPGTTHLQIVLRQCVELYVYSPIRFNGVVLRRRDKFFYNGRN